MFRYLAVFLLIATSAFGQTRLETSAGPVTVSPIVTGLDEPWGFGFLPGGAILITERDGALLRAIPGQGVTKISGVPEVETGGQGGLLDVLIPRDFAQSREIFLSFSKRLAGGTGTAVARAVLAEGSTELSKVSVIFEMSRGFRGGRHFGSRIVEARDGTLFVSLGDRAEGPLAQDLKAHNGKIIRINRDGSIPSDNPFASGGGLPEIWSYGHRNPQGATLDAQGRLWTAEHGAKGGDEVNQPRKGANYGWPVISYGRNYSGTKIGEGTTKAGMEQPVFYWDPSIAPSGMMIYSGKLWPAWTGDMFVGSLKFNMISRLSNNGGVREAERLFQDKFDRIRDVREAPDGTIWFLSVIDGALYRAAPS